MKEEGKSKKSSKKWIIAIVLIIIAAIAVAFYQGIFSIPTGLAVGTETATTNPPATPATPTQPTFTVTGTEIITKEVAENLPYYESVNVEPGMYVIEFTSDVPVWMFVYNEMRFNQWKEGKHTFTLTGTACCKDEYKIKSFTGSFKLTESEGNKAFIVVEGAEEASIKFKITQTLKFE